MKNGGLENQAIADLNTILRVRTGSQVHGISTASSDRDEVGVCIPPPQYIIGLRNFEMFEHRDAEKRTGKADARSLPGELDLKIYSLRKFTSLVLNGNPSMIELLFTPDEHVLVDSDLGQQLRNLAPVIVSKEAVPRYIGYLKAQKRSLLSGNGKGRDVTRPELIAKYGYEFAAHMVRLGLQGIELLETGRVSLPMRPWATELVSGIRQGKYTMEHTITCADHYLEHLRFLETRSDLPDHPDRAAVDTWLIKAHDQHWAEWSGRSWKGLW